MQLIVVTPFRRFIPGERIERDPGVADLLIRRGKCIRADDGGGETAGRETSKRRNGKKRK